MAPQTPSSQLFSSQHERTCRRPDLAWWTGPRSCDNPAFVGYAFRWPRRGSATRLFGRRAHRLGVLRAQSVFTPRSAEELVDPEGLGERPGLERAAGGAMRRIAVADLGEVIEAGEVGAGEQRREKAGASRALGVGGAAAHADPGFDEGAGEPGPDGAVVVAVVALGGAARVVRVVARISGGEGAQAGLGPQDALDGIDHGAGALALEHRVRDAADGEDLVGAAAGVDGAAHVAFVDDVVELAALGGPEPGERDAGAVGVGGAAGDGEGGFCRCGSGRRRSARSSPEDFGEYFAKRGHVIGVEAAELAQHQAGLDGGEEWLDDGGLEESRGLPVDDGDLTDGGCGTAWLVIAIKMRSGRSRW